MAIRGVAVVLALSFTVVQCMSKQASVYCEKSKCLIKQGVLDVKGATACGTYNDTMEQTGWGILNIRAGYGADKTDNTNMMFAAGYLESFLTQERIYQHFLNLNDYFAPSFVNKTILEVAIKEFFTAQDKYMRDKIVQYTPISPYWRHAAYILAQYDGLVKGYMDVAPINQKLSLYAFQLLNGNGDMLDMIHALDPDSTPDWKSMSKEELMSYIAKSGHCSALIKVLGAYEDVFMSHSSWFTYQATMRIYKHYDFNVDDKYTGAKQISFSSYPGFLESLDDFYILGSQMVMLQTTNNVFNESLYDLVTPHSLLAWHRVRLASMMAVNGTEWGEIFSAENSGTYNNQYMILDLKKIKLNEVIEDNALTVVEQIPGLVEYGDTTPILRTGYWASYNVPYFEKVYDRSGYPEIVKMRGLDFSYQLAPRAKIFRRDEGKVKDLQTMKAIMRYNDYIEDPYSEGDSCNSICCRGDLRKKSPGPFGCYDTKVTDYNMALKMTADILNGPTTGTDKSLPPFAWTASYKESHVGLPAVYNFDFLRTKPSLEPQN